MTLICYKEKKFSAEKLAIIEQANTIIGEYQEQGFDLTLRQLYYQFVARGLIANKQEEYKRLGDIVSDGRMAGLISWDAITDRTRNLQGNIHFEDPAHRLASAARNYQIDKWKGQEYRPEVWIEKDALVGVIDPICRALDVDFFSCRGYTSMSEMHVAAKRLEEYKENGQEPVIIHLGDHDPSGIDMSRDILDRMALFMGGLQVDRIALNMDQVQKYNPPPNPAKVTDPRASGYIKKHGRISWELDALDPKMLSSLIMRTVQKYRDDDQWEGRVKQEEQERAQILKLAKKLERE